MKQASHQDTVLQTRILEFLKRQSFPALRRVEVDVHRGTVTFRGRVNSFYERQLCIHACGQVPGVSSMNDGLKVRYP